MRGFSLIETLIVMAMTTGLLLAIGQLTQFSSRVIKGSTINFDWINKMSLVSAVVSNQGACTSAILSGTSASGPVAFNPSQPMEWARIAPGPGQPPVAEVGKGSGDSVVSSMSIEVFPPGIAPDQMRDVAGGLAPFFSYPAILHVRGAKSSTAQSQSYGGPDLHAADIPFHLITDGAKKLVGCYGQWAAPAAAGPPPPGTGGGP